MTGRHAFVVIALLFVGVDASSQRENPPKKEAVRAKKKPKNKPKTKETRCDLCHVEDNWKAISYPRHQQTRFPLKGEHLTAACVSCHEKDFDSPIPNMSCRSCHRDAHSGRLGMHCEGCHDERGWKGAFTADGHRNTNFPLQGKHGLIPCEECHQRADPRATTGVSMTCVGCHQQEFLGAAAVSVDHVQSGFNTACRTCHYTWQFEPGRFVAHDACFQINGGPHSNIRCTECHASIAGLVADGACVTNNAECTDCHRHGLAQTDKEHQDVLGYQYKDAKCYECHRFAVEN